jgi:hypothetical protein
LYDTARRGNEMRMLAVVALMCLQAAPPPRGPLDPRGRIHIPIGTPNTLDMLKTFVEAEGNFSPGFGTYGIYFWVYDPGSAKLTAPTMEGMKSSRGLIGPGHLVPWTAWEAGRFAVRTEVCQVCRVSPGGNVHVVAARAHVTNAGPEEGKVSLIVALRPLGAAGGDVRRLAAEGNALLADGRAAVVAGDPPDAAGVVATDTIGNLALEGKMPSGKNADSEIGDCSGALRFDLTLAPGKTRTIGFVCPVFPGRRAVGHQWDGKSPWAQFDLAKPNPPEGGLLQPDPGLEYYRSVRADVLFEEAAACWKGLTGRVKLKLPDPRWGEGFAAMTGHVAMAMNEDAPDVSVVNYNVYSRDGVYTVNILQKSGQFLLAERAIDYFLAHPFNGRVHPEADNPGQILWIMGEHWLFARDCAWLDRVYPSVKKLAAMIRYYRTNPGPHWVCPTSLVFGEALPSGKRQELKPGSCDGFHPEYTEAFDIAGIRAAVTLAGAKQDDASAEAWKGLAADLFEKYDQRFGGKLPKGYGSYSVLWPCRLYPLGIGKGHDAFKGIGAQKSASWRYFPLATAHQGLFTGSRPAGHGTLDRHLEHEQMQGWYAFDEGGESGTGGWDHARTTWKRGKNSVAMPHGWSIAEVHLLLRDCLLHEDGNRLVLLGGVAPEWLSNPEGMEVEGMPTHFGPCSFRWAPEAGGTGLTLTGARPPGGFVLRVPPEVAAKVTVDGEEATRTEKGDFLLPAVTAKARIEPPKPK